MSNNSVLIVIEMTKDNEIMPISLEALATGRRVADEYDGKLQALIMGSGIGGVAEELRHYGIDIVYSVDNTMLKEYQPEYYLSAFERAYKEATPKVIIMGYTLISIDLLPRIAFRLKAGLIMDCVGIGFDSGELIFTKPVYSSNVMAEFKLANEPYMVSMRSRVEEVAERSDEAKGELVILDVEIDTSMRKIEVIERVEEKGEGPKLENADIIVAGGRGIGGSEGFEELLEVTKLLGGALGASRPPCDLGWINTNTQIGLTGTIVGPSVYIAVGISGSTQHMAGMSGAKVIVAINMDRDANIFKVANYGVVGNYEEVIPGFKGAIEEILK